MKSTKIIALALLLAAAAQFVPSYASAQEPIRRKAPANSQASLLMVSVDRALLSRDEVSNFEHFINSTALPKTKIGEKCRYYGRPQVWCLILDDSQAREVFSLLQKQSFNRATKLAPVRRLKAPERS